MSPLPSCRPSFPLPRRRQSIMLRLDVGCCRGVPDDRRGAVGFRGIDHPLGPPPDPIANSAVKVLCADDLSLKARKSRSLPSLPKTERFTSPHHNRSQKSSAVRPTRGFFAVSGALSPESWIPFWLEFPAVPGLGRAESDKGIEVLGRPEGVHSQQGSDGIPVAIFAARPGSARRPTSTESANTMASCPRRPNVLSFHRKRCRVSGWHSKRSANNSRSRRIVSQPRFTSSLSLNLATLLFRKNSSPIDATTDLIWSSSKS